MEYSRVWTAAPTGARPILDYPIFLFPLWRSTRPCQLHYEEIGRGVKRETAGNWIRHHNPMISCCFPGIDPTMPTTIYAGTYSWGVFKSIDGGASWNKSYNGLTWSMDILTLAIDPTLPTTIYEERLSGVFKSTDREELECPAMVDANRLILVLTQRYQRSSMRGLGTRAYLLLASKNA